MCPSLATVLINTYRNASELFVDGSTLFSEGGTTQGDPLAMPMYALATIPLINQLDKCADLKQVWYADDATATGSLLSTHQWWNHLVSAGPVFGYLANASKTWLLTKKEHLDQARSLFQGSQVNITTHGRPHLGAPLGSMEFIDQFVTDKVHQWMQEIRILSDLADSQPHASHAAFTHGYVHNFSFLSRTTLSIESHLRPLETCIRTKLINSLTGESPPNDLERDLLGLPPRLGGFSINPTTLPTSEFSASQTISSPLSNLINEQRFEYPFECVEAQQTSPSISSIAIRQRIPPLSSDKTPPPPCREPWTWPKRMEPRVGSLLFL